MMLYTRKTTPFILLSILLTWTTIQPWGRAHNQTIVDATDTHNPLSNRFIHKMTINGRIWPSVDHYMCAMSFTDPALQQRVKKFKTAKKALQFTRSSKNQQFWMPQAEWNKKRDMFMQQALEAKFSIPAMQQA